MWRFNLLSLSALILIHGTTAEAQQNAKHEKWGGDIESFRKQDKRSPPTKGGIVFIGDSDIVLCELDTWFPDAAALNRGFGGSHMDDVGFYLHDVLLAYHPKIVVLSCGGNDITNGDTPANVHKEFKRLVARLFKKLPNCRLLVTSQHTPPLFAAKDQPIRRLNQLVKQSAAKDKRITFLPGTRAAVHDEKDLPDVELFRRDQVHFNYTGYRKWTKVISAQLRITK